MKTICKMETNQLQPKVVLIMNVKNYTYKKMFKTDKVKRFKVQLHVLASTTPDPIIIIL